MKVDDEHVYIYFKGRSKNKNLKLKKKEVFGNRKQMLKKTKEIGSFKTYVEYFTLHDYYYF